MKRIDCAERLVETGVDLISGGSSDCEKFAIVPMFQEYRDYGSNEFIHWAVTKFIPNHPEIDFEKFCAKIPGTCHYHFSPRGNSQTSGKMQQY